VIDTAGNVTALPLSDNGYTLDTSAPSIPTGTHTVAISNDTGIIKVTASSAVVHALLLPVVTTQSVPLALTCHLANW
jgi:hypothetical protein